MSPFELPSPFRQPPKNQGGSHLGKDLVHASEPALASGTRDTAWARLSWSPGQSGWPCQGHTLPKCPLPGCLPGSKDTSGFLVQRPRTDDKREWALLVVGGRKVEYLSI